MALIDSVHRRLLDEKMKYRTINLKIRFTGFETYTRAKTLRFYTSSKEEFIDGIKGLSDEFRHYPKKVRLVGARVSNLQSTLGKKTAQGTLEAVMLEVINRHE